MEVPESSLLSVAIRAADVASLSEVVRTHPVDFGCRPRAVPHPAGGHAVHALLTPDQLKTMRQGGSRSRSSSTASPPTARLRPPSASVTASTAATMPRAASAPAIKMTTRTWAES